jgi:PAS domain S-box-containing protein
VIRLLSPLRARLLVLVIVAAVPTCLFTMRTMVDWRHYRLQEELQEVQALARMVAASKERLVAIGRERLLGLSRMATGRLDDASECRRLLQAHWTDLAAWHAISVMAPDGRSLCELEGSEGDPSAAPGEPLDRTPEMHPVVAVNRIDVRKLRATATFVQPVVDVAGQTTATLVARANLSPLREALVEADVPRGTTITLLDHQGTILAREPDAARWVGQSALGAPVFRRAVEHHGEGTAEGVDLDGQSRLFAYLPVRGFTDALRVVVATPLASVVDEGDEVIRESVLGIAAVAMLALAVAWVGADVLVLRPTRTLVRTARRLAVGDLRARTGLVRGSGELHELSRAFDDMAAALEARECEAERTREALRAAHDRLEERVEVRTAELLTANQTLKKLSSAVEEAADSVLITNRDGMIEYVNPAFERLTGYTAAEAVGQTPRILKSDAHDASFYRTLWQCISSGGVFRGVLVNRKKDGTRYYEEKTITPIRDERGAVSHYVSAGRDVTDRKRAEDEVEQSREALRALAAHLESVREDERARVAREVHDELGQTLTALKFDVHRLVSGPIRDEAALGRRVSAMTELIDQTIASVRRIQTELRPAVLDDLGLVPAIEWQAQQLERRIGIRCRFAARPEDIEPGPDVSIAVFRIVQETLTNVVRHAEAQSVDITLETEADTLTLTVRDDGRGITDAELEDRRSTGLTGMRERARLLGGRLTITGRPGAGTTVRLDVALSARSPA